VAVRPLVLFVNLFVCVGFALHGLQIVMLSILILKRIWRQ